MRSWLTNLQPRERNTIVIGIALVVVVALWAIADSYSDAQHARAERINVLESTLAWMEGAAREVSLLRGQNPDSNRGSSKRSLLAVVDATAKKHQLGGAVKRMQPEGKNGVKIWLESASFDTTMRWLSILSTTDAIRIERLTLERQSQPGRVDGSLTLTRSGN